MQAYLPWIDFIVNGVMFWFVIALLCLEAYNIVFHKGIPNIRTAPAIRAEFIRLLKEDFGARRVSAGSSAQPYTIVDLGSGNGLLSREIAKALPEARVIGVELARQSLLLANWQKERAGLSNLSYVEKDLFDFDLSQADAVVFYLIPPLMKRLGEKLHAEAKPGTLILSNKFKLGDGWEPAVSHRVKTRYFHQGEIHVYRAPVE